MMSVGRRSDIEAKTSRWSYVVQRNDAGSPAFGHAGLLIHERRTAELLLSVFLAVSLSGFLGVVSSVVSMPARGMGVVGGLLVLATLMMFRGFAMVASGVAKMLGCLPMVFCCFLGHQMFLVVAPTGLTPKQCSAK
jgi:hypothetical protein